jgi:uncharacterized protein YdeI (YjbR/CyaY-like superfamily)
MSDLPKDIAVALKESGLLEFFADCTPSHQQEYLKWIGEAKRPETRERRIGQAMKRIAAKKAEEEAKSTRRKA